MNMREVKAVLAIITDSKKLIVGLKISISSPSPELRLIENGIVPYLDRKQRTMQIRRLMIAFRLLWMKSTWRKTIKFW